MLLGLVNVLTTLGADPVAATALFMAWTSDDHAVGPDDHPESRAGTAVCMLEDETNGENGKEREIGEGVQQHEQEMPRLTVGVHMNLAV